MFRFAFQKGYSGSVRHRLYQGKTGGGRPYKHKALVVVQVRDAKDLKKMCGWRGEDEFQTSLRDRFHLMTPLDGDSRTGVRKKEDMFRAYQPHF